MHIHRYGPWQIDYTYIDTSFGDRVPSTALIRFCKSCARPKTKHLYGTKLREVTVQLRGRRDVDTKSDEYIRVLKDLLRAAADDNGMIPLSDAENAIRMAVIEIRIAEAMGVADALTPNSEKGTLAHTMRTQLLARAEYFITQQEKHGITAEDLQKRKSAATSASTTVN